ncbi:hypothetical protein BDP27DRAFT_1426689 [Rhodocollybia butyracea]|uniref:Uncharacterized protein n=1 Tax=Rhodocollybia butyracea TaxID=206335 RepID=A0A9P5U2L9_9AGAR|nr:hypothetical protein BDP27DRAFT_1426689 [Rhodocollybia butyracea]
MNEVAAHMGSSFSIDLTDLSLASASWKGHIYTGHLPDDVQTEVLQEIFEISFKQEFMLLDQFLYRLVPHSQGREDGEFENDNGPPAFGHPDGRLRQATLHTFFQIMRGWTHSNTVRMNSTTVHAGERVGSMSVRGTGELKETEFYLAAYYIHALVDFFKRAPTMPHFL